MINKLNLIHFKSHKNTTIELKNLTVLCGGNGVGKSSFIQALLLLRQTFYSNKLDDILFLNGQLYEIGAKNDALHVSNDGEFYNKIVFNMEFNNTESNRWLYDASDNFNFLQLQNKLEQNKEYEALALFNNNFQYISAFRGSDQVLSRDFEVVQGNQISYSKGKGDMVAHYLNFYGKKLKVIADLRHPDTQYEFLSEQVNAWESDIINSGIDVVPDKITDNQYAVRYNFKVKDIEVAPHKFSADNVGFGLSYVLPIVVALLSSKPGSLVIIENPEAHLHPHSISRLTELICIAAQAGIQIILETHSDHIINGIMVQAKRHEDDKNYGIDRSNVKIYQFERNLNNTQTIQISTEEGGRIYDKPEGFFDQIANDLRELF